MQKRIFMAMAHSVGNYEQSDYLYLMRLSDGRIAGYTSEFDCFTCDIKEVCSRENYLLAKWFDLPLDETKRSVPATMDEIRALGLEKCLIGTKADMGL